MESVGCSQVGGQTRVNVVQLKKNCMKGLSFGFLLVNEPS